MSASDQPLVAEERAAIGRTAVRTQRIDPAAIKRFDAAVGGDVTSPLAHWAFFHDIPADAALGEDGHPRRGGFLPALDRLPRRMFAGSSIAFATPLVIDAEATATLRIADVRHRHGATGELVFVDVERTIEQADTLRIRERQTLVYRTGAAAPGGEIASAAEVGPIDCGVWRPGIVNLFRFSAATFNGHRIHYDRRFATVEEGYPDLVVHGPFIAARLAALAARRGALASFEFRASAPCFVDRPIRLEEGEPGMLRAIRDDGTVSMTARATCR